MLTIPAHQTCAEFAKRLNYALDLRKYPPLGQGRISYLQEIFGLSRAGANKWLHGKALPHRKKRVEIAEKLGINLNWLETGEGDPLKVDTSRLEASSQAFEIPLLSMVAAYDLEEALKHTDLLEKIVVGNHFSRGIFGVEYVGLSMFPKFPENSILLVDPQQQPEDGDIVLAISQLLPEAICRQYVIGSRGDYLVAVNDKFAPIEIDENVHIIGKVIEIRSEL